MSDDIPPGVPFMIGDNGHRIPLTLRRPTAAEAPQVAEMLRSTRKPGEVPTYENDPIEFARLNAFWQPYQERYVGEKAGKIRQGKGVLFNGQGKQVYEGDFDSDEKHGMGIELMHRDPHDWNQQQPCGPFWTYTGQFKKGFRHGWGTMIYPDGKCYVGQWKGGERVMKGWWKAGNRHGFGTLFDANGIILQQGKWSDDLFVKEKICFLYGCDVDENLQRCAGCKKIWYCCQEHQSKDWPRHTNECKKVQE